MPMIRPTIIAGGTTIAIAILKVFDIVYVMTGGRFETEVIANRMFNEMFAFRNYGRASAIAVILFVAVVPIMIVNIRNLRRQGIGRWGPGAGPGGGGAAPVAAGATVAGGPVPPAASWAACRSGRS